MSKATSIIVGIVALLAIGGLILLARQNPSSTYNVATTTPTTTVNPDQTTPSANQSSQPGVPVVATGSDFIPTDTTVVVKGTANPNGDMTTYWYEYGPTSTLGTKTTTENLGSGFTTIATPGYITGLIANSTYYFRLVAENQYGKVAGAAYSFKTTQGYPPPVGGIPGVKTLAGSTITRTSLTFNGQVNPNQAETTYWFEYGNTANLGQITPFVSAGNGNANANISVTLTALDPLRTYYFRLDAQNQFGTVNGSTLNAKTTGPAAPGLPSANTTSANSISSTAATLRATISSNGADTTYWFEYSTDPLLVSSINQTPQHVLAGTDTRTSTVSAAISGLNNSTTYYFRVMAQNSVGSVQGGSVLFMTK